MDITLVMGAAALSLQLQKVRDMGQALAAGDLDLLASTKSSVSFFSLADCRSSTAAYSAAAGGRSSFFRRSTVLDNLLSNVCKYAMPGTRVYVDLGTREERMFLTMKNGADHHLQTALGEALVVVSDGLQDDLVDHDGRKAHGDRGERFGGGAPPRHTEGSGLGLNIARSLMDLMDGTFQLSVDGDLFKAELSLKG